MKDWDLSIGFYPGILIGMRTYHGINTVSHVFYLPLIDLCLDIYYERADINRNEKRPN